MQLQAKAKCLCVVYVFLLVADYFSIQNAFPRLFACRIRPPKTALHINNNKQLLRTKRKTRDSPFPLRLFIKFKWKYSGKVFITLVCDFRFSSEMRIECDPKCIPVTKNNPFLCVLYTNKNNFNRIRISLLFLV